MEENKNEQIENSDVKNETEYDGIIGERLRKCEAERQEYLDGWQRAKADYINLKRLESERREEITKYANESFAESILETVDTFEHAFANKELWEKADESWRKGIEAIYSKLLSVLEKNGVSKIKTSEGGVFDPLIHQAVGSEKTDDETKDETVHSVVSSGYKLQDKVIRPSKVKIWQKF